MERGQGGRGDFGFGDPFAGFGRGFGRTSSFFPSLFGGGQDPFDNPFFSQPFGSMMGPSMFGPSMFGQMRTPFDELHHSNFIEQAPATNNSMPSMFGQMRTPFDELHHSNFIEQAPATNNSRGIVIRELDEEEHGEVARNGGGRSTGEPHVQEPDEEIEEGSGEQVQFASRSNVANYGQPQARNYSFQSSRVTYGGVNGAYYTSSTTRRSGSDGISLEENREADTTTGRATHRVSRGIHDKGHSVTRRLNSDGRVDTAQMLHNLEEDELPKFEENWRGNARQHLPEWNHDTNHGGYGGGGGPIRRDRHAGRVNALPPTEQSRGASGSGSSRTRIVPIS